MRKILYALLIVTMFTSVAFAVGISRRYETLTTATVVGFTAANLTVNGVRAEYAFVSVETADVRCTFNGTTPTTTAGGSVGHLFTAGTFINIEKNSDVKGFRCINAVAGNGAKLKSTIGF